MLKRALKWTAITIAGLAALFLFICTLIVWCLTPPRLTPLVERHASAYLDADVNIGRVELTFWHTFPKMTLDVDSLSIVSHSLRNLPDSILRTLPADADSLLSIKSFHAGINIMPLMAGRIALYDVLFHSPRVNLLQATPQAANYDIFPASEPSDTTPSSPLVMPAISINRFAITDATPLRYRSIPDTLSLTLSLKEATLSGIDAPSYTLAIAGGVQTPLLDSFNLQHLTFGADGKIDWDMKRPLAVRATDFTLALDSLTAVVTTEADFTGTPLIRSFSLSSADIPLPSLLHHLPEPLRQLTAPLRTDIAPSLTASLTRPWALTDTLLPSFEASLVIPTCRIDYENWSIRKFDMEALVSYNATAPDSSLFTLRSFHADGEGVRIDLKARASNIVTDPFIEGTFNGDINLSAIPRTLRSQLPGTVTGRIDGKADFRLNASDLKRDRFHRMYAKGNLRLRNINADIDSVGHAFVNDATFELGSNTSFIKDTAKIDSLLTLSLRLDTLAAQALGMDIQIRDLRAGAGTMNRASSSDTTEINPFGARLMFSRLSFDSPADTLRVRMRDASVGASLKRYEGNARLPQLNLTFALGGLQFGQALTKIAMRQADVDLSVNMRPRRTPAAMPRRRMTTSADSANIPANRTTPANTASAFPLDSAETNLLRRWDFSGHIHAQTGRLVTPAFPLRNTITHIDLHFNQDSIRLENLSYKAGQSDFLLNGTVSNLRRALTSRRGNNLGVHLTVSSDTLNVNEIVKALFAGGAISQQADSATVWNDDEEADNRITAAADTTTASGPLLLPRNIDAQFSMRADHVLYSDMELRDFRGDILMYDGAVNLRDLSAAAEVGRLDLTGLYSAPAPDDLQFGMGLKVSDFRLNRLSSIIPAIDSLLPVMQNFAGTVNADVAVTTGLTPQMDIDIPSLKAAINIQGDSLVLLDPDTFKTLSKWLFFKDKKKNYIDHMAVEILVENSTVELFPFMFDIDRYRLGVMGHNDLAMNLNYHISVLKSPIPFKFGINITGTPENPKIRTGGAKFKENMVGERQEIADNTRVNIVQQINSIFQKGISNARMGRLNFSPASSQAAKGEADTKALLEDFDNQALTVADSLRLIRQGLIANPDTIRFPVKPVSPH